MRCLVVAGLLAAAGSPASADILKLGAEVDVGAMEGTGTAGAQKDNAFFANSPPFAYGALINAELFGLIDAYIQHDQFTNGDRLTTWTQFGVGLHFQIPLADPNQQKLGKGAYIDAGLAGFFGVGTGQQVMPPLDNAQITDKGFLVEGKLGFGTHLNTVVDLGISIPVSWGYFFKNGNGIAANDTANTYQGAEGELFGYIRFNLKLL
jgi:hypothetical protein